MFVTFSLTLTLVLSPCGKENHLINAAFFILSETYIEMSISKELLHAAVISNYLIHSNWFAVNVYNKDHS